MASASGLPVFTTEVAEVTEARVEWFGPADGQSINNCMEQTAARLRVDASLRDLCDLCGSIVFLRELRDASRSAVLPGYFNPRSSFAASSRYASSFASYNGAASAAANAVRASAFRPLSR